MQWHTSLPNVGSEDLRSQVLTDLIESGSIIVEDGKCAREHILLHDARDAPLKLDILNSLVSAGVVQRLHLSAHRSHWALSRKGLDEINMSIKLSRPRMFFCSRAHIDPHSMTSYELVTLLLQDGWSLQLRPKRLGSIEPYKMGEPSISLLLGVLSAGQ